MNSHPSWYVIDSTKLKDYAECPRKYLFRHILGWEFEEPNIHLIFGDAWHQAMEILLQHGYGKDAVEFAHKKLTMVYRQHFTPVMDDLYYPKTPAFARDMLEKYVKAFSSDHSNHDVLYTEMSGSVPIAENKTIFFKTDSILRGKNNAYHNKVLSREHKTASRRGNKWDLAIQVGTYNHVLYCLFGPEEVAGVEVSEAIFQKTKPDFIRTTVQRGPLSMQDWLLSVNSYYDAIMSDIDQLLATEESDPILECFLRRETACDSWGGCKYYDFCISWHNPLQRCDKAPMGMTEKYWDPREKETTYKMNIGGLVQVPTDAAQTVRVFPLHIETIRNK